MQLAIALHLKQYLHRPLRILSSHLEQILESHSQTRRKRDGYTGNNYVAFTTSSWDPSCCGRRFDKVVSVCPVMAQCACLPAKVNLGSNPDVDFVSCCFHLMQCLTMVRDIQLVQLEISVVVLPLCCAGSFTHSTTFEVIRTCGKTPLNDGSRSISGLDHFGKSYVRAQRAFDYLPQSVDSINHKHSEVPFGVWARQCAVVTECTVTSKSDSSTTSSYIYIYLASAVRNSWVREHTTVPFEHWNNSASFFLISTPSLLYFQELRSLKLNRGLFFPYPNGKGCKEWRHYEVSEYYKTSQAALWWFCVGCFVKG